MFVPSFSIHAFEIKVAIAFARFAISRCGFIAFLPVFRDNVRSIRFALSYPKRTDRRPLTPVDPPLSSYQLFSLPSTHVSVKKKTISNCAADRNQFLETETISTSSPIFRSAQPSKYGILLFNYARFLLASTISFFFSFCKLSIFFFYGSLSVRYVKPVVFKFSSCCSRECEFSCFC